MPQHLCEWFEKSKEGVTREEYEEEEGRQVPTSSVRMRIRERFIFLKINGRRVWKEINHFILKERFPSHFK